MIGYAFCGSFCTHQKSLKILEQLRAAGYELQPIFSETVYTTSTRFGTAEALRERVKEVCGHHILHTIPQTEPLGPGQPLEALLVCPCTGNTLAKLAHGITDTAVTMAVKAQLRCDRPVILAVATNDALSANLGNLATMRNRKNVWLVPLRMDDPEKKPHSLVADFDRIPALLQTVLAGRQE